LPTRAHSFIARPLVAPLTRGKNDFQVVSDGDVTATLGAGELLGLSWLFRPYKWRVSARACEPTTTIVLHGAILREYSERDHSLGFQLFKRITGVMTRRLEASIERLFQLAPEHHVRSIGLRHHAAASNDERRCEWHAI
jgi:CRP-like cAMP-binding protein